MSHLSDRPNHSWAPAPPERAGRRRRTALVGGVGLAAMLVASLHALGCSVVPKPPPAPHLHDFGLTRAVSQRTAPVQVAVDAPGWLDGQAIVYRLLYDHPTELRQYARNRWVAAPAALLEQVIESQVPPDAPVGEIRVELEAFEQDFSSPSRAFAVIRLRLEWQPVTRPDAPAPPRQVRRLTIRRPTVASVDGAVVGLSQVAQQAAKRIVATVTTARAGRPVARPGQAIVR